jgi:hypothetical protein
VGENGQTQRANQLAKSEKHPLFLDDFATPCQFFWLARWGVRWKNA